MTVDEQPQVLLNLVVLALHALVLLFEDVHDSLDNLVSQVVNVRAALNCADGVYEANLLELAIADRTDDLPAVA